MMGNPATKRRLYTEREKVRHTTHWDMDYLPIEEVERYYFEPPAEKQATRDAAPKQTIDQRRLGLFLICIGAGLFAAALTLGRLVGS